MGKASRRKSVPIRFPELVEGLLFFLGPRSTARSKKTAVDLRSPSGRQAQGNGKEEMGSIYLN
jgi:hypothetical protein